jgi:hypothetical protein
VPCLRSLRRHSSKHITSSLACEPALGVTRQKHRVCSRSLVENNSRAQSLQAFKQQAASIKSFATPRDDIKEQTRRLTASTELTLASTPALAWTRPIRALWLKVRILPERSQSPVCSNRPSHTSVQLVHMSTSTLHLLRYLNGVTNAVSADRSLQWNRPRDRTDCNCS